MLTFLQKLDHATAINVSNLADSHLHELTVEQLRLKTSILTRFQEMLISKLALSQIGSIPKKGPSIDKLEEDV